MNQIWVSGDWHLFNRDPFDKRHPTRTPDEFQTMYDNYVSAIKEGDLFLFLGDLCDAETITDEELELIKSLLRAIPGYKIMMRGNHDTMDDYFYLMLGFDEICEIGKCHHLVFSHKPCLVGIDEINIHAHLHSEKDHMLNFQHMNVWKWTELNGTPDKPVLLQDLFDLYDKIGNTAESNWGDPDIYQSKDKLSPWKKLSDYSEKDVLDFSDKFTLAPMDETAGDRTMEEIINLNDRLNGFKYGFRSNDGISDEYLSDYRVLSPVKFERARGGVCWDFAVYQADYFRKNFPSIQFTMWYVIFDVGPYWPTHTFMTFRYEGKTYYFESSFKRCAGVWEVESEEDAVNFVMHEMDSIDTGVDDLLSHDYYVYRYNALDVRIPGMSAPEFMKHIEKKGHTVKHIYRNDYTVSLYSPVNESADTSDGILDEVLFQDIEQTKRWLADDDAYQNELDATEYSDSRKPTKMRGKNDVIAESSKRKVYKDPTELRKPDRAESNKLAKKYDIPNVGRTTPEEYEEARKSPEERSAEKRERQLTQLQRARSVKKRKAIVRKVKSKIPFVKNESVEAIALRSDRIDTTGSIYTKVMQSEGGKITEYAMMCADLIHSITSINPELLDAQRILTVQSAEELIAEFKRQQSEWIEQYNKNITFDHQLALLYQVMNARRRFKIKEAYPYLIPYNLSPEKFRQYVQYRIDEWREMINILEESLRINLQFLVLDSAEAARISSITDKKHFIKEMKKVVDQNADRITEKHPDGSRTIDFSLINRGKVFICGQIYDEQKFMRKPSQYLARLSYYDYIIVTHGGSLIKGTWTMDPITFDNVSYDKVTDLLDVLGQDGSQILVMACNPDGIKLPPKKYSNVDYADANVIMESGGAISNQIDLSNWSKEIKKSIKRVNKLKAIINTCVTDAYLLTPPDQIQFITAENFELSHDTNFVFATVAAKNDKKAVQKYHYAFNTILGIYESINHAANIICAAAQQYGDSSNRGYRVKAIREDIDDTNLYESFWAEGNQICDGYLMPEDIVLPDPMMCCEVAYAFDLGVRNGKPFACNYLIETIQNGSVVDCTPVSRQELYDVINASSDSVIGEYDISSYDSTEHSPLYGDRKRFFYNYDMPKEHNTAAEKLDEGVFVYKHKFNGYTESVYRMDALIDAIQNKTNASANSALDGKVIVSFFEDILDNYNHISPEFLDRDELAAVKSANELIQLFLEKTKEIHDESDEYYTGATEMLHLLAMVSKRSDGKNHYDSLVPTGLTDRQFMEFIDLRIQEMENIEDFVDQCIVNNGVLYAIAQKQADVIAGTSDKKAHIKALKEYMNDHEDEFIHKRTSRHIVAYEYDFSSIGRGIAYVSESIYSGKSDVSGKRYVRPSRLLVRAALYDYIVYSHGDSNNNGVYEIDPVIIDNKVYTNVHDIIAALNPNGNKKVLILCCNSNRVVYDSSDPKFNGVKYPSTTTVMESTMPKISDLESKLKSWGQYATNQMKELSKLSKKVSDLLQSDESIVWPKKFHMIEISFGEIKVKTMSPEDVSEYANIKNRCIKSLLEYCERMYFVCKMMATIFSDMLNGGINESGHSWSVRGTIARFGQPDVGYCFGHKFKTLNECVENYELCRDTFLTYDHNVHYHSSKPDNITLYEMTYEDYCDHFYTKLKSLAAEYNKREDIFKHTTKILKCDQKDLPKFECRVETSSEKQLCFSMVDPDTSFEIKCEYEKYLKEMIKELEKDAKEYPGAKSIWTADAEGTIYVNLELGQLNEAAIKRVSDDGKPVPKTCPKCGAKIGLYLKGEPVWLCSNQKCGAYYGTVPMNESHQNEIIVKVKETTNPNDGESNKAVELTFYLGNQKIGEAGVSGYDTGKGFLYNMEVEKPYRGRGYGKYILNYVMQYYSVTDLSVAVDNDTAIHLYEKAGFRRKKTFRSNGENGYEKGRFHWYQLTETISESADTKASKQVYHGSPLKLNVLKPQNRSLEARDYVFASPDRNFALCYAGNAWNDFMINQSYLNDKLTLIEIEPGAFEKAFNTSGYLYTLDGNDFPIRRSSCEVMTDRPVKPKSIKRIQNVYNEIKHSGIRLYHYGTWPKDHIFKSREEYLADRTEKFKHYIQESYQFELVNKTLRFMDPINESVNKTEKLYPVYIMLVHSGTAVSNVIKKVSHSEYSHASISFDSSMSKMYSFARKDPKNPFIGGFRYESIGKGFYEKKEVPYGVYVVPCTEDQIKRMKKRLAYFEKNQEKFTFDFVGLVTNYAGIVNNPAYSWFCSRFVADILNAGSPEGKVYVPEPSLQDPDDFKRAVFARYVTSGDNLMKYNQKEVDRATKRILRAEEMYRKQLNESVYYNRFDPTDPYAVTVMRYQLSNMNEAAMDEFLRYIKSFHVELDPNGNVILTRRVYNQLDHHFIQTKQALKTMKKAGDLEGMKENLAKLYYMIQLITDQYMDKKTVSISKTVKKDMIDLRSVMLNVFQQNLQYVEEMDPKFNFQSYYDGSVYGKKTKIPISGITSIGKTLGTLL